MAHPKIKILPLFTNPYVVPIPNYFLCAMKQKGDFLIKGDLSSI